MSTNAYAIKAVGTMAEAIRELKSIPSGHLYAVVMEQMNLQQFQVIISILKRAGLVSEANDVLTWIGPVAKLEKENAITANHS